MVFICGKCLLYPFRTEESIILILLLSESRQLCSNSHFITKSCQMLYKLVSSYICCCLAFLDIWCRKLVLVAIISLGSEVSEVFIDKWTGIISRNGPTTIDYNIIVNILIGGYMLFPFRRICLYKCYGRRHRHSHESSVKVLGITTVFDGYQNMSTYCDIIYHW